MKTCLKCKQSKALGEFHKDVSEKDGLRIYCRHCCKEMWKPYGDSNRDIVSAQGKERRLKTPEKLRASARRSTLKCKYGLTEEAWRALLSRQENKCGCCGESFKPGPRQVAIDHCHKTGVVRGLLCMKCNTGLGQFKDSPERLLRAVGYLKKFEYLSVLF